MRLLLDMDGPMAHFDQHFWDRCIAEGWEFDVDGPNAQTARFFTDHMPVKAHRKAARAMVDASPWFRDLPVTPGAQEGVQRLLDRGIDIWVCTKPLEANPTCHSDKASWLSEHFPELANKLILAPDKSLIQGDVLLDDAPAIHWIPLSTWRPVIFTATFNGPGSKWEHLPHWSWDDPIERLIDVFINIQREST